MPLLAPVELDNSVLVAYIGHLLGVGATLCLHGLHIASGLALFWSGPGHAVFFIDFMTFFGMTTMGGPMDATNLIQQSHRTKHVTKKSEA